MVELFFLIFGIIVLFAFVYYKNSSYTADTTEGFDQYYLQSCPKGFNSLYDSDGNIICCDGDVVANKCISDRQCTLSASSTKDMPNCVEEIMREYAIKGKDQCPPSLPSYFEDIASKTKDTPMKKGCTKGLLNATLSGPNIESQPKCMIHETELENINNADSCFNQKRLEEFVCFGNNCTKQVVSYGNSPALILVQFADNNHMPHGAYSRESLVRYFDVVAPNWKEEGWFDPAKSIYVAEVAKAFYVDKTMQQADVKF